MRGLRNRYVVVVLGVKPKWNFMHYACSTQQIYILCLHLHNCIHLHTCVHLHILLRSCNFCHIFIDFFAVCSEFYLCSRLANVQTKEKIVQIVLLFNLCPEFFLFSLYVHYVQVLQFSNICSIYAYVLTSRS